MADSELNFAGTAAALLLGFLINLTPLSAADFPRAEISNGQIAAKIYLPDAKNEYYRPPVSTGPELCTAFGTRVTIFTERGTTASIPK